MHFKFLSCIEISSKHELNLHFLVQDYIKNIRVNYTKDFTSKDPTKRQISVATYLIDKLALRAGNEKVSLHGLIYFESFYLGVFLLFIGCSFCHCHSFYLTHTFPLQAVVCIYLISLSKEYFDRLHLLDV